MTPLPAPTAKPAKILVIEDDMDVRRAIALWLARAGYEALEAADGREGLASIRANRPEAVLLDLRLPGLDGFGVLEALDREGREVPPVIIISGQDEIDGVIKAFRMGAADYLQKPIINLDLLSHAIEAVLDRARLSRAVARAESRYFTLVQNLPLLVFVLRPDQRLEFINKFCRTMLGFARHEALQAPGWFLSRVHPADRERVAACLQETFVPGQRPRTEECRLLHKNGSTVHAILKSMPSATKPRQGEAALVEGIVLDITDRVELERFVVQEEKLKTLGAISAEVAHEIRNPLFSIAGFAHRLQARLPDNHEAEIILSEARRLEEILDRISNYLHPVDLRPRLCSLNAIVTTALDFLVPEFSARRLRAETRFAATLPDLQLDPDLLSQVVVSLVRFAVKRLPEGAVVRIGTSRNNRFAHLDVGYALQAAIRDPEMLFFPFEEGEEKMGLPLAYRIVKNMGGSLTFEQKDGEGFFTVLLPLGAPYDAPPPEADEAAAELKVPQASGKDA